MKYAFVTFGCRLSKAETLDLEAALVAEGNETVKDLSVADVIVVRCCSVTARAQHDCEREIAHLRREYPSAEVVATGCIPGAKKISVKRTGALPKSTARAWLKIQDGCSGKCAFCTVPLFRGAPVSVPFEQVIGRAAAFYEAGYREIVLTGCNTALYRSGENGLADVISSVAAISPDWRVRLSSLEPGVCDSEVLDVFSRHSNICRFVHLSVQSGSDRILNRMRRRYRSEAITAFAERSRRAMPDICLGGDFICGFPGETDEDFSLTVELVQNCRFANLHVFPYSERPGTEAERMAESVHPTIRKKRAAFLEAVGKKNIADFAAAFVGKKVQVCVEKAVDGHCRGYTGEYLPCEFNSTTAHRRDLVFVDIDSAAGAQLSGKC